MDHPTPNIARQLPSGSNFNLPEFDAKDLLGTVAGAENLLNICERSSFMGLAKSTTQLPTIIVDKTTNPLLIGNM